MISATELRIGNMILFSDSEIGIVYEVSGDNISVTCDGCAEYGAPADFSGIPLTEEWLLRLGFTVLNPRAFIIYNPEGNVFTLNIVDGKYYFTWGDVEIKYLHTLQNLFQILTNTELEVK